MDKHYSEYDRTIYRDLRKVLESYSYDFFEIQYDFNEYYTIDFIFILWDRNRSYKYYFTRKNNNDTWYGISRLIQFLIIDNLTFKGVKKIN